ncbi:hypothetical protein [Marinomonas atlantica]|uniref:hypothetical protein n=1 Tax=Marinomonas atlantica TaxID=1806668 RepID=UPI00082CAD1A|nr:hypothetical protein [Marinomonas atlantica]
MSNYARIINNVAVDVSADPDAKYHPQIASEFQPVPDDVKRGWVLSDGEWSAPIEVAPVVVESKAPTVSVTAFMLLWTSKERVKLKQSRVDDPIIDDFFDILDGAETVDLALNSTQQGVEYCLTYLEGLEGGILAGVSVADRKTQILSGELQ